MKNYSEKIFVSWTAFPLLGKTLIASSGKGVVRIAFGATPIDQAMPPALRDHEFVKDSNANLPVIREISEYLEGKRKNFSIRAHSPGTDFQRRVWQETACVPYGETMSYGRMAARLGMLRAARAVGNALGANPVPLIVPCHRIIRANGSMGGFGAGNGLKEKLLELEA